jgi:asparagine synthase (glutamine-hydrolysing)
MIDRSIADEVRRNNLTYLSPERIESLFNCIDFVHENNVPGDFAEFGVALGGSGICLARSLNGRRYFGFDVFGMIPPPSDIDGEAVKARYNAIAGGQSHGIGGDKYYGYEEDLFQKTRSNFEKFGCPVDQEKINLIKGLFHHTIDNYDHIQLSISHIDCDWYDPVFQSLNYSWAHLSPNGLIIVDDYNDWSGCGKATDAFLELNPSAKLIRSKPHAVIQKPEG